MLTTGSTVVSQFIDQERILRDAPSAASRARELHRVECDDAGAGVIYTGLGRIVGFESGVIGTTAGNAPAVDIDNPTYDNATGQYTVAVAGAASTTYSIILYGNSQGA